MSLRIQRFGPDDAVAVVALDRGKGNALDQATIDALLVETGRLREDGSVGCLVLTSTAERFFSVGFDLLAMDGADPDHVARTLRSFCGLYHQLFFWPKPVVAAVGGHALAGGAILALTADFRVGCQGNWQMGVTEINLGVPLPPGVHEMIVEAAGPAAARRIAYLGETFDPPAALQIGLLDSLEPTDRYETAWKELAIGLAARPTAAYVAHKAARRALVADAFVDGEGMAVFQRLWFGEEARARRRAVVEKLRSKVPKKT